MSVKLELQDCRVLVEGSLGLASRKFSGSGIIFGERSILVKSKKDLYAFISVVEQMVEGVSYGYYVYICLEGRGYRLLALGSKIYFKFSSTNYKVFSLPKSIKILGSRQRIILFGLDKELVYRVSCLIKKVRDVEPYKGKGLRNFGDTVELKIGKQK